MTGRRERWRYLLTLSALSVGAARVSHATRTPTIVQVQPAMPQLTVIAAGTEVMLRITNEVGSAERFAGAAVNAILIAPLELDGHALVAPGAHVWGRVTTAGRDKKSRAVLRIVFDSMQAGDRILPISLRVTGVDNASETVDSSGVIAGVPAVGAARSRSSWVAMMLGTVHPVAAAALFASARVEAKARARAYRYPPGTDVSAKLERPLTISSPIRATLLAPADDTELLQRTVSGWPLRVMAFSGREPADLLNVAIIGDSASITRAFLAAGWSTSEGISMRNTFQTFVRAVARRGYAHQPVSQMLLDGRPPDLVFQKVNNTFAKRHHIRLWRVPGYAGAPAMYLAGATHDVGITFVKDRKRFTHRIEPQIDRERDKVVNDLWSAGCAAGLSRVARAIPAGVMLNDGRDAAITDGAIAVVRLSGQCGVTSSAH
jgi:hypothetical protein